MRRLPSLRRRGSWGWVGADWWGEVAIALGPSSRGCGAQRPRMASCFTGLEAEQNDALHNGADGLTWRARGARSEEHTSELQSLMRISYAVFCLKKKNTITTEKFKQTTK